jgi:hypothetical protein
MKKFAFLTTIFFVTIAIFFGCKKEKSETVSPKQLTISQIFGPSGPIVFQGGPPLDFNIFVSSVYGVSIYDSPIFDVENSDVSIQAWQKDNLFGGYFSVNEWPIDFLDLGNDSHYHRANRDNSNDQTYPASNLLGTNLTFDLQGNQNFEAFNLTKYSPNTSHLYVSGLDSNSFIPLNQDIILSWDVDLELNQLMPDLQSYLVFFSKSGEDLHCKLKFIELDDSDGSVQIPHSLISEYYNDENIGIYYVKAYQHEEELPSGKKIDVRFLTYSWLVLMFENFSGVF